MANRPAREADSLCKPTCPAVDEAFGRLESALRALVPELLHEQTQRAVNACCDEVKRDGTLLLRDALITACGDKQEAEDEAEELRRRVDSLEDEVASLRIELRQLEAA